MEKKQFAKEMYEHLTEKILPFWMGLRDDEFGGYCGYVGYDLNRDRKAVKGCILNSRILWFFSNTYMLLGPDGACGIGDPARNAELAAAALREADHAYDFMNKYCIDREYGGVLWALNYDGSIADDIKHTYNQAFSIYALASYYAATGRTEALKQAFGIFDVIEGKCTDSIGYLEAFNRDFTPAANDKLSENGVMADKTMNTLLHVFEAYTELLRVLKLALNGQIPARDGEESFSRSDLTLRADRVAERLKFCMDVLADKIYNPELERQEVFFDAEYRSIIDLHSYGHDIETSWLADRGLEVLGDPLYKEKLAPITKALAERIYLRAYTRHSLMNECERGVDNTHRIWWVQAETVLGFANAARKLEADPAANEANRQQKRPDADLFYNGAVDVWEFIKTKLTDSRPGSEWFWELDEKGEPYPGRPIVEPWKCPYHNGRMCMEIIRRFSGK